MIDKKILFSLVQKVGDTFWVFGTVATNTGLAWQHVAIKPGPNMAVLLCYRMFVCAMFSTNNV